MILQKTGLRHNCFRLLCLALFLAITSCSTDNSQKTITRKAGEKLRIVTTTGIIADAVRNIAGEKAEVISIMGPGVDPHLYKATQGDLEKLTTADLVIYNGLHLEGKMGEVLEKLSRTRKVVTITRHLDKALLRNSADYPGSYDPHIWFNVALWQKATAAITTHLTDLDPENTNYYLERAKNYATELNGLHNWATEQIATIPESQRVLITAHDAFGYFGDAYKIEVRGLQGISTVSEFGLRDVSDLVGFITERKIKAVFVESSVPKKAIEAVVTGARDRGHEVSIGGELFSDALGQEGTPEGTYAGMVRHNVNTITRALR